jgi:TPR repeat protein
VEKLLATPLDEDATTIVQNDAAAEKAARDYQETGNRAFRAQNLGKAIDYYTKGAELGSVIPRRLLAELYCDRATAHLALDDAVKALGDADFALKLNPQDPRAHQRLAEALGKLERYAEQAVTCERGLVCLRTASSGAAGTGSKVIEEALNAMLGEARHNAATRRRHDELNTAMAPQGGTLGAYEASLRARAGTGGASVFEAENPLRLLLNAPGAGPLPPFLAGFRHVVAGHDAGREGRLKDALQQYGIAANVHSHPEGMYMLAVMLSKGRGTTCDLVMAEYWARKATEQPLDAAMVTMGMARSAVGLGQGAAWNMLGNMHAEGWGVSRIKNDHEARLCYEKSADLEYMGGLNNLGMFYLRGRGGLQVDVGKARSLMILSSERGDNQAMCNLGSLCLDDLDLAGAVAWYQAAVDHGALHAVPTLDEVKRLAKEAAVEFASEERSASATSNAAGPSTAPQETSMVRELRQALDELEAVTANSPKPFRDRSGATRQGVPTAEQMRRMQPRCAYLERLTATRQLLEDVALVLSTATDILFDVENGLASPADVAALKRALDHAGQALRAPDAELVASHELSSPMIYAATVLWKVEPSASLAAVLSHGPLGAAQRTTTGLVANLRRLHLTFPDDDFLQLRLGQLLMFRGPDHAPDEGFQLLRSALASAERRCDPACVLDRRYSLAAALIQSDHSFQRQEGEELLKSVIDLAVVDGHRKAPIAYALLAAQEFQRGDDALDKAAELYEASTAARSALPEYVRQLQPPTTQEMALGTFLAAGRTQTPSSPERMHGGDALPAVPGTVPVVSRTSGVTEQLRRRRAHHVEVLRSRAELAKRSPGGAPLNLPTTRAPRVSTWHGNAADDRQLTPAYLSELLAPRQDRVFDGRALTVLIVSPAVRFASIMLLVEDGRRDCVRLAVYGVLEADVPRWVPGRIVRIRNPYVRMAADDRTILRVDHPAQTVQLQDDLVPLCWNCLVVREQAAVTDESSQLKACGRCRVAQYCSVVCQRADWTENGHKEACASLRR